MSNRREFFRARLHSLLGVIPVGLFLMIHLVVNHYATKGEEAYNAAAGFMGNLPFRLFLEIFVIFLPILYHAIYGIIIAFKARNNVKDYGYFRNWMFLLQRVTGFITFVFVLWHVWETRIQAMFGATVDFNMMAAIVDSPIKLWIYVICIVSAIFHFCNGLWSFCITWGITVSPRSQQIATYVTMGLFILISYIGLSAIFAFVM